MILQDKKNTLRTSNAPPYNRFGITWIFFSPKILALTGGDRDLALQQGQRVFKPEK